MAAASACWPTPTPPRSRDADAGLAVRERVVERVDERRRGRDAEHQRLARKARDGRREPTSGAHAGTGDQCRGGHEEIRRVNVEVMLRRSQGAGTGALRAPGVRPR
jgi:hypothetical protein